MANSLTGIQFLESGKGFLALNKQILALVSGMDFSTNQATEKIMTAESSFWEGAVATTQSGSLSGDFICTSGLSFSYYSGYTGTSLIQSGTVTGTTNGLALFNTQLNRTPITYTVKLATGFVARGSAIIDSISVKYKAASELSGSIKMTLTTKPTISTT